jgi:PST family polysaccharide transporter
MFAPDIIMVVLGPKWKDAGIIFRLLTPTILIFAMINPFAWLLFSYGLVWRGLKIALVIAPLTISAYLIGLPYGPKGVAFAFSVAMAVWFVPHIAWCIHGTIISFHDVLSAIGRPMLSGIGAASFAFAVQLLCGQLHSPLFRLVLGCGLLFGAYLWMLLYVMGQRSFYLNLFRSLGLSFSLRNKESAAT